MKLLKTLRPAAYTLLGMIGLTLSAQAQDYTRQNAIDDAAQYASEQAAAGKLTQNQSNLWIALAKGSAGWAYDNLWNNPNLQFDNNGNLLNGTALQQSYVDTFNKLSAVLYDPNTGELNEQLSKQALNQLSPGLYTALPTILFN
ncbi:MAG: hypothetical protein WAL87_05285, partial [Chthoniobacterales bacterium]